jgi:hypothetical protein
LYVHDNSSSSTSIPPPEITSVALDEDEAVDYTDPFDISRNLFYGLTIHVDILISRTLARFNPKDSHSGG